MARQYLPLGIQHDYTRKGGLVWEHVFLPPMAPAAWQDRETLWNAVEEAELHRLVLAADDAEIACRSLVEKALENNARDNVTAIVVDPGKGVGANG